MKDWLFIFAFLHFFMNWFTKSVIRVNYFSKFIGIICRNITLNLFVFNMLYLLKTINFSWHSKHRIFWFSVKDVINKSLALVISIVNKLFNNTIYWKFFISSQRILNLLWWQISFFCSRLLYLSYLTTDESFLLPKKNL